MTGIDQFELLLGLLTVSVLLSTVAPYLRVPPAAAFVLGGMALAAAPGVPTIVLDPDLVLVLFLPPLLSGSAFTTVWRDFRADLGPIMALAVGAVVFTTATVGWVAKMMVPELPWAACFTLGAIVSPPDAVAAKAVLTRLPLPRRLVTILEGESLLNDASGLVLYRFAAAAALSGTFSPARAAGTFLWLAIGGVAVGLLAGFLEDALFRRMRDRHHVIITSFLFAYASYIVAERLHVSGVLSVVCCGLVLGSRQHATLSADVRMQALAVWQVVIFALEALVFVLIGLSLRGVVERLGMGQAALAVGLPLTLAVTASVIASRFLLVFPAVYFMHLFPRRRRSARTPAAVPPERLRPGWDRVLARSRASSRVKQNARADSTSVETALVVCWAGMRGVVSLAAALALPQNFPGRDEILLATFGVILATVLLQGTTLGPLVRKLHLAGSDIDATLSSEAARAHVMAITADWLQAVLDPVTGEPAHPFLLRDYRRRADITARFLKETETMRPVRDAHFAMALSAVAQCRSALLALHRESRIHDTVLAAIEAELDLEELHLRRLGGLVSRH